MSVLEKLAGALGRSDERPNVELAAALAAKPDAAAVAELAAALSNGNTAVQNDAVKVLYELGALSPELVASHPGQGPGDCNPRQTRRSRPGGKGAAHSAGNDWMRRRRTRSRCMPNRSPQ